MKSVFAPHLGHSVKFGRKPRIAGTRRVHFSDFVAHAVLPSAPAAADFSQKGGVAISDVYQNDELGCCVVSGGYHLNAVWTGNAGTPFHATGAQIIVDYSAIGGYKPGDSSTDQGCNEDTAISYWTKHGFANGVKLLGGVSLSATSKADVMASAFLFENTFLGIGLPDPWVQNMPNKSGFVWDVAGAANPDNGHCVVGVGYDATGLIIDTWGLLGHLTWAAVAKYCAPSSGGEIYSLLTADMVAKGQTKAPNGMAWADLVKAFDSLGGNVPVPAPAPAPPAGPTVQQVQQMAAAGVLAFWKPGQPMKIAEAAASSGIAIHWPPAH